MRPMHALETVFDYPVQCRSFSVNYFRIDRLPNWLPVASPTVTYIFSKATIASCSASQQDRLSLQESKPIALTCTVITPSVYQLELSPGEAPTKHPIPNGLDNWNVSVPVVNKKAWPP